MTAADPKAFCCCAQHGVTLLDDLLDALDAGESQWDASIRLWGPEAQKKARREPLPGNDPRRAGVDG